METHPEIPEAVGTPHEPPSTPTVGRWIDLCQPLEGFAAFLPPAARIPLCPPGPDHEGPADLAERRLWRMPSFKKASSRLVKINRVARSTGPACTRWRRASRERLRCVEYLGWRSLQSIPHEAPDLFHDEPDESDRE